VTLTATAPSRRASTTKPQRRRGVLSYWRFYLALSPFYLIFLVFGLYPVASTILLAFQKWDGLGPRKMVGLQNFGFLIQDSTFWLSLWNTVILFVMSTVPTLVIAMTLAVMLHSAVRFKGIYRIAYFIPNITSLVAAAIFFAAVFSTNFGLINSVLRSLGLPTEDWLRQPWGIKIAISTMIVWQWAGYNTIIYLAGLQAIPTEQYEAAKVDGAGPFRTFFSITLPQLRPVVLFTVIMSTIGGLQTFTEPHYGYAGAIALSIFMLVLLFTAINWKLLGGRGRQ
jgi:cellobiose transport system permease protein